MPILQEDKQILETIVANFHMNDSVAVARLIYETLADARMTRANPQGLSFEAATSFGRLIFDKTPWNTIPKIEEILRGQSIRHPIIKSCDTIFRTQLATALPKLADAEKQVLGHFLDRLDDNELMSLVLLVYETLLQTKFVVHPDPKKFSGMHPLTKFLEAGLTWEDLKAKKTTDENGEVKWPLVEIICLPLIEACHQFLRPTLPMIFRVDVVQTPEEKAAEDAATPSPAEITPEIAATNEAAASATTAAEGEGASDLNPFAEPDASKPFEVQPAAAEPLEAPSDTAEPLEAPYSTSKPLEAPSDTAKPLEAQPAAAEPLEAPSDTAEPLEAPSDTAEPLEAPSDTAEPLEAQPASLNSTSDSTTPPEIPFEVVPENGARTLTKKERRELRRKQREEAPES